MGVIETADYVAQYFLANPVLIMLVFYIVYRQWQNSRPWPDVGGRITSVHTLEEWQALCAKKGPMIVDFYATWCPPCKAAAPIYARMSEEEAYAKCTFAKVNVDEVRAVASSENVSAMPTFGFFEDGKRSTQVVGFSEAKIRQMLNSKLKLNTVNDNPPKELQKVD